MSFQVYKRFTLFVFSLLMLWGVFSLWGYVRYYYSGHIDDRYAVGVSVIIEAIAIINFFNSKKIIRHGSVSSMVLIWLLYTIIIVCLTGALALEVISILWWPSIYILFYNIFRSEYSKYGFKVFRDFFIPVSFVLNTTMFLYLRFFYFNEGLILSSNQVFYVSLLLPSLFLLKKRWMKFAGIIMVVVCAALAFKRSTLLVTLLTLLFSVMFEMKGSQHFLRNVLLTVFVVGISIYVFNYINKKTDGFFIERINSIEETGGSGRMDIYSDVIEHFSNSRPVEKIFGIGYNSVVKKSWAYDNGITVSAHNDFLEIMVDFGIVGLLIYVLFAFRFIKNAFRVKSHPQLFQANIITLVVFFVMSSVSHLAFYPTYFAYIVIIIALTQASIENHYENLEIK